MVLSARHLAELEKEMLDCIMKRIILFFFLFVLLLAACAPAEPNAEVVSAQDDPAVTVYRAPT
jgi:hypothetical protein